MLDTVMVADLTYGQRIGLVLLDKGVLALVLVVAVAVANKLLQDRKSRDELLNAIADSRVYAYRRLWAICKQVRFVTDDPITEEDRRKFDRQLNKWYWEDGGAMLLSWTASRRLMKARNRLRVKRHEEDEKKETKEIKGEFSALRTQLKYDCGVLTRWGKWRKIGNLKEWSPELKDEPSE
jgi:hypothetical protein